MTPKATVDLSSRKGNKVYEGAVAATGLADVIARSVISNKLQALGISEHEIDIETLGSMLPQIETRVRLMMPPAQSREVMSSLGTFILNWDTEE